MTGFVSRIKQRLFVQIRKFFHQQDQATLGKGLLKEGIGFEPWLRRRHAKNLFYSSLSDAQVALVSTAFPRQSESLVRAADLIAAHEFSFLGSGRFIPADHERAVAWRRLGYVPIDWCVDPVRHLRFPQGIPHKEWDLFRMRPANADIKYPWELSRCQHFVSLGQAFLLTRQDKYALEIANQVKDFMEANPVGVGVNWVCTMDVAIRAANWAIALEMVAHAPCLDERFWKSAYHALFEHGHFIYSNLENHYEVTSNHFLSNIVGLYYVALVFRDIAVAREWEAFCKESLEREIIIQINPDGSDYESSVPYHRLVTELFMGPARLGQLHGKPFSEIYLGKLQSMLNFLAGVLRPDGLMPQIGDADDGRLHIMQDYGDWQPQDSRHLFGVAGKLFNKNEWFDFSGDRGAWEAAWWGFDIARTPCVERRLPNVSAVYPDIGIAATRQDGNYLLVTNGRVGTKGFGNHKHNELLGFEYHVNGIPICVDPGSYVYTCDFAARNQFRSTAYHNTLMVDGVEQNELNPEWLFRLFESSDPEFVNFQTDGKTTYCSGRHSGYMRLPDGGVIHERYFEFHQESGLLLIVDRVTGKGRHNLAWHFHFAPGAVVALAEQEEIHIANESENVSMIVPEGLLMTMASEFYSPSYGVQIPCNAINLQADLEIESSRLWGFAFYPKSLAREDVSEQLMRMLNALRESV